MDTIGRLPLVEIAARIARDRNKPNLPQCQPPELPALQEITPLAEEIATAIQQPQPPARKPDPRGRKPKWDWECATLAVFDRIYRGEVPEPKSLAEVETLLAAWFAENMTATHRAKALSASTPATSGAGSRPIINFRPFPAAVRRLTGL
jgi:hypothetical protein